MIDGKICPYLAQGYVAKYGVEPSKYDRRKKREVTSPAVVCMGKNCAYYDICKDKDEKALKK